MELTKDYAGQMFLLLSLVAVIGWLVGMLIQFPSMFFTISAAMAKRQPSSGVQAYTVLGAICFPSSGRTDRTIALDAENYNLRVRKEGFDIQHLMNSLGSVPRPLADTPGTN